VAGSPRGSFACDDDQSQLSESKSHRPAGSRRIGIAAVPQENHTATFANVGRMV
jgi:hypothetical protein